MARQTVAIIGGGFTGTLLALYLLRQPSGPAVILAEREHPVGRGLAYSTPNPSHSLNVPAGRMSAFAEDADDFLAWLRAGGGNAEAGDFIPREVFGRYVRDRLDQAVRQAPDRLTAMHADVDAIHLTASGGRLCCVGGPDIAAERIVLATGNYRPQKLPGADDAFLASPVYRADPWAPDALAGLPPDAAVLLVGTGLTMVDVVISLLDAGHRGPIQAISRRGLVPHPHAAAPHPAFASSDAIPRPFSQQLHQLRRQARAAGAEGVPWQAVLDRVRHHVQDIWGRASDDERRRFLRHARPWWDVHRHRIAPAVARRIDAARASGQLRISAGRLHALVATPGGADVTYTPRGGGAPVQARAARVINCTGPSYDFARSDEPLMRSLLAMGLAEPDALRLGLHVNRQDQVVGPGGRVTPNLYALGPITRGTWWEITSVPDIRGQCARLADQIGASLAA